MKLIRKERIYPFIIYSVLGILFVDFIYKSYFGINYQTRESCILYASLPRWAFILYEFTVDLFMTVLAGIFLGTILQKYFTKYKRFYPRNQFSAFFYAAVIPVCSCSAIPMIGAMHGQIRLRNIITFVVAAPLLNPYIVALSFTVLGNEYAVLRILASLILAVSTGYFAELVAPGFQVNDPEKIIGGSCKTCTVTTQNIYTETFRVFRQLIPYLFIAGSISLMFEIFQPYQLLEKIQLKEGPLSVAVFMIVGMPIYLCNGADILFLQPLVNFGGLSLETSLAFSLTSSAICISSFMMLIKYLGKKLTINISLFILLMTFIISELAGFIQIYI